ncbi:MAG TPA: glycosyltransferase family 39 protein [Vicinamibacterales bacterium]|nr:glycosyltransferase family 39 protein [Vicinamibacterales bacterium]
MPLPYDAWSVGAIVVSSLCLLIATRRTMSTPGRLAWIAVAAFIIRLDPAAQSSLHLWDESVHAVIARHMAADPLTPALYTHPILPPPIDSWTESGVWLHKPPLTFWLIGVSLATFGMHAIALRLPSLLVSTLAVVVTFLVGRRVFDVRIGLLAAAFQAVNGLLVSLSSGRRVADHVDTLLLTCVELGVLAVVTGLDNRRVARSAWLAGAAMGLGVLTKSFPALIVAAVAAAAWQEAFGFRRAAGLLGRLLAAAALVCGPWMVYVRIRFPEEATAAARYTWRHVTTVVEGHEGSVWAYVDAMPRFFGELVYLPLAWFLFVASRPGASVMQRAVAVWLVVPYLVFSLMATKLSAFIAIAAPAIFLAEAWAWMALRDRVRASGSRVTSLAGAALLVLLAALPARLLLEPTGSFERRDRHPVASREAMELERTLGLDDAVVFNVPHAFEMMFYTRYAAYGRLPLPAEIEKLHERGIPIFIYQPAGQTVDVPVEWRATVIRGR